MKKLNVKLLFWLFAVIIMTILANSCKKDLNPPPANNSKKYTVSFAPSFNGDVIPGLKNDKQQKAFGDFQHKFFNHVIRIRDANGATVIDIPITNSPTNTYQYDLTVGQYTASVLPIAEEVMNGNGNYSVCDLTNNSDASQGYNRAGVYTRNDVPFSVPPTVQVPVTLNAVTDLACLQFSLSDLDYIAANTPIPELVIVNDAPFLTAHSGAGNEGATWSALNLLPAAGKDIISASGSPSNYIEFGRMWWDDVSKIYYCYRMPGSPVAVNVPGNNGQMTPLSQPNASYLAFGVAENNGSTFPVVWCKDYYASRTWVGNTTLRISYTQGGTFTINMTNWFNTIINN